MILLTWYSLPILQKGNGNNSTVSVQLFIDIYETMFSTFVLF